ncbi:MAG: tripartite tricarboxylate transporter substrate binding protein [Betaproteobacteria bacterium]|nr:tripartite tricarboxylate transporter substrate binding protein [Betaproteobacteria bacterium]
MKTVPTTSRLALRALTACLIAVSTGAHAQDSYPTKPIRIIVPAAAGGGADITARMIAPRLSEHLGQQVVVENQGGGGTVIGMERVARAAPDGYTLAIALSSLTITPYVMPKLPYNPAKDFAPISQVLRAPSILVSHPSLPARSLKELIAFVKANPAKLSYASPGFGGNQHLGMELFLLATGLKMGPAHYKGMAPAVADVVAGHVPMIIGDVLGVMPHIKAGRLRAYGVTSANRVSVAPDVPTIAEAGVPGFEVVQWFGILAPANTPRDIIAKLHAGTVYAVQDPATKEHFIRAGGQLVGSTPEEFAAVIRDDLKKWGKVIKDAGIEPQQ